MSHKIRDVLGQHLKDNPDDHREALVDCLTALCLEVGRLRWLSVAEQEVTSEEFDKLFKQGMLIHYEETKEKYGYQN